MIIEAHCDDLTKKWRYHLQCEQCLATRWVGAGAQHRKLHPCRSCRSKAIWCDSKVVEKRQKTCLVRYGSTNAFQSPQTLLTVRERYGVDNVGQSDFVKTKIIESTQKSCGADCSFANRAVQEKSQQTMLERYGCKKPLQSAHIKSQIDFKAASQKRHETMKARHGYGTRTSKIETEFYRFLTTQFPIDDVRRHVFVNNWSIDFYVQSIETYVQFDGVYWHGLREVDNSDSPRAQAIRKVFEKDRQQDAWFTANNLRLIRITDEQFRKHKLQVAARLHH